jgi:hypothetical protein
MDSEPACLVAINGGGIADLTDATSWRIAPGHLRRAAGWRQGVGIAIEANLHFFWKHKLLNLETAEHVYAVPSRRRGRPSP